MNSVAPRKLKADASPIADQWPSTPPAVLGNAVASSNASVARPQLVAQRQREPPMPPKVSVRARLILGVWAAGNMTKPASASMIGNR